MSIKEMPVPLDVENLSEGVITIQYSHQIRTTEEYVGIFDLQLPHILVGLGQLEKSPPIIFFANRRHHEDLEYIIKKELGENAVLIANGQFTHFQGSSGHNQLDTLGLNSTSVSQTPNSIVEQNLQLLLGNISPSFLAIIVNLTWRENGIERRWIYRKHKKQLVDRGIAD